MKEGLGAEVGLVFELWDHYWTTGRTVETFDHGVVESLQRSGLYVGMPNDIGDELHDNRDDVRICGPIEHPGYALRVQHVALPVRLLVEPHGWVVERTGHSQLGMVATGRSDTLTLIRPWLFPLGEHTLKPLPGSLGVLPALFEEADGRMEDGTDDEGERGLEWAVVGCEGRNGDDGVKEETDTGETDDNCSDHLVDGEEVMREGVTEEEKSKLEQERQTLHDEVEAPGGHSVYFALAIPTASDKGSSYVDLGVSVEPLLAQHGDERGEDGGSQTREKDALDMD